MAEMAQHFAGEKEAAYRGGPGSADPTGTLGAPVPAAGQERFRIAASKPTRTISAIAIGRSHHGLCRRTLAAVTQRETESDPACTRHDEIEPQEYAKHIGAANRPVCQDQ